MSTHPEQPEDDEPLARPLGIASKERTTYRGCPIVRIKLLPIVKTVNGRWWCRHCRVFHRHGFGEGVGHRHSHCHNRKSPFFNRGYLIREEG